MFYWLGNLNTTEMHFQLSSSARDYKAKVPKGYEEISKEETIDSDIINSNLDKSDNNDKK